MLTVWIDERNGNDDDDDDDDDDKEPRGKVVSGRNSTTVRPLRGKPSKRQIRSPDSSPVAPEPKKARHQSFGKTGVEIELPPRGTALSLAIASSSGGGSQQRLVGAAQQVVAEGSGSSSSGTYFLPGVDVKQYWTKGKAGVSVVSCDIVASRGSV